MAVDRLQADDPSSKAALPHKAAAMSGDTKRGVGLGGGGLGPGGGGWGHFGVTAL